MPLQNHSGTARLLPTAARTASNRLGTASESMADDTMRWLERTEALIERYPWPTLFLALVVGYAIARRMR